MIETRRHDPQHRVRDRLTLVYSPREGDPAELALPKVQMGVDSQGQPRMVQVTLKAGENKDVPTKYFHVIGGDPKVNDLIAAGVIAPKCGGHVFDDGQPACRYCGEPNPLF